MGASRRTARRLGAAVLALGLCLPLSCSELPLKPRDGITVEGAIRDENGPPVGGATIVFADRTHAGTYPASWAATADDSGRYRIEVPAGWYDIWVYPPQTGPYRPVGTHMVELRRKREVFDFTYRGVHLTARILGPDSSLLAGARIDVHRGFTLSYTLISRRVDDGVLTILLEPESYSFRVSPPSDTLGMPSVDFVGIQVRSDTTVAFQLTGEPVAGRLDGPDGLPLPGASIRATGGRASARARTDAAGLYDVLLPPEVYEFRFYPPAGLPYLASRSLGYRVVAGPTTLDWEISGSWWSGEVKNRATGAPLSGASVRAVQREGGYSASDTTGGDGRYSVLVVPGKAYDLEIMLPGQFRTAWIPFVLAGGDSTIDVDLDPYAAVRALDGARRTAVSRRR